MLLQPEPLSSGSSLHNLICSWDRYSRGHSASSSPLERPAGVWTCWTVVCVAHQVHSLCLVLDVALTSPSSIICSVSSMSEYPWLLQCRWGDLSPSLCRHRDWSWGIRGFSTWMVLEPELRESTESDPHRDEGEWLLKAPSMRVALSEGGYWVARFWGRCSKQACDEKKLKA